MKIILLVFLLTPVFSIVCFGQTNCTGDKIFTEKSCTGDEISETETKIYQLINEYRQQNKLAPVTISKSLSLVANRHLLDINANLKKTTHSWSNCEYDLQNSKTWHCVSEAAKRLNSGYEGQAYENLYRNFSGSVEPSAALAAWEKSDLHNSLILNLNVWKNRNFDSFGVAVDGQYASIWFGEKSDSPLKTQNAPQGLGISYAEVVKNLSGVIAIEKTSSVSEQQSWNGVSKDKTVTLEINGTEKDITNAAISLKIKLESDQKISTDKRQLIVAFVNNIFGKDDRNEIRLDESLTKLNSDSGAYRNLISENKVIEIRRDKSNNLVLTAKPYKKPTYREVF